MPLSCTGNDVHPPRFRHVAKLWVYGVVIPQARPDGGHDPEIPLLGRKL